MLKPQSFRGPQTPRLLVVHPPFRQPGYSPVFIAVVVAFKDTCYIFCNEMQRHIDIYTIYFNNGKYFLALSWMFIELSH